MAESTDIVGRGWSFPPDFDRRAAGVRIVDGQTDIEQSLRLIFETQLGERCMRPTFGSGLAEHVFDAPGAGSRDTANRSQLAYLQNQIRTAILYHEPRIDAEDPVVEMDLEGTLQISVEYTIRGTNSRFNFVHPFYLREDPS